MRTSFVVTPVTSNYDCRCVILSFLFQSTEQWKPRLLVTIDLDSKIEFEANVPSESNNDLTLCQSHMRYQIASVFKKFKNT